MFRSDENFETVKVILIMYNYYIATFLRAIAFTCAVSRAYHNSARDLPSSNLCLRPARIVNSDSVFVLPSELRVYPAI